MNLRSALPSDIPAMAAVTAASYRAGFKDILDADTLATRDANFFSARFAESWPRMTVAVDGASLLGIALVTNRHLDMLFVAPSIIGQGVGAALLAKIEADGAQTLECFRDNRAARRFYERQGWAFASEYEREFIGRTHAFVAYEKRGTS